MTLFRSQASAEQLQAQAELEWRRCAADPIWFFENHWMILHPKGKRLFELREPQREVLDIWLAGEDSITLKARQIGWSTLVASFAFHKAFFKTDQNILLLSKGERESVKLLAKAKYGYKHLPKWMKQRGPELLDNTLLKMSFDNDSIIESLPSGSDPARGYTGNLLVADEFAFLTNPDEAWASMEPVTDVGGQKIVLSTANGHGNLFHREWLRATLGESSMVPSFYSWRAVPERDDDWYAQKAADMEPWALAQEYPDNPDEAFVKSGNMVFDFKALETMKVREAPMRGRIGGDGRFHATTDGELLVWELPDPDYMYSLGADVAEGLGHGDYSVSDVLTVGGLQVAHWHGHLPADQFAFQVNGLGLWFNGALAVVEVNSIGQVTVNAMRDLGYPNLWVRDQPNKIKNTMSDEFGFKTTRTTKPMIIENLGKELRDGSLQVQNPHSVTELKTYVRDEHGRTNGSPFDDRVMSLALANHGRAYVYEPEYAPEIPETRYSGDWWGRQLTTAPDESGVRIGRQHVRSGGSAAW